MLTWLANKWMRWVVEKKKKKKKNHNISLLFWAISADNKLIFSYFSLKIGFDTLCILSPKETICMKFQIVISGENKKKISNCILKFLPSMLSVKDTEQPTYLGPVAQSTVSLTSSLRVNSLTVLADSIHNTLIFFQQKILAYLRITRCKF